MTSHQVSGVKVYSQYDSCNAPIFACSFSMCSYLGTAIKEGEGVYQDLNQKPSKISKIISNLSFQHAKKYIFWV